MMIIEAVGWTAVALVGPDLLAFVLGRWSNTADGPTVSFGRWLRSLGIPYLALITGAVAARDVGLSGRSGLEWLQGGLVCAALLALARVAAGWRMAKFPYPGPTEAALDEARWALYRGTGSFLADPRWAGPLIGLGIGVIEWALHYRPWAQESGSLAPAAMTGLVRLCGSTLIFLLTRNLWLIVMTEIGLSLIFGGIRRESHEDQT